ncbi:hypothetical protein FTX61_11360 [Nitriliruptoraceae bacterium ZYF776]|nr:hypothetical protein [Profundirhabdus halotolerans]
MGADTGRRAPEGGTRSQHGSTAPAEASEGAALGRRPSAGSARTAVRPRGRRGRYHRGPPGPVGAGRPPTSGDGSGTAA